jgi:hypothetical protein
LAKADIGKTVILFGWVERVAVIQGVPAKSFATRIAEGLPSDISGEDAPAPAKVVPSRLPPAWGKAEHVTVDYSWAGHGLSLTGIVAVLKVTDGRVISVTAVGPAMAEERVRRAVETLAGTLTIAGVGIGQ